MYILLNHYSAYSIRNIISTLERLGIIDETGWYSVYDQLTKRMEW